MLFTCQQLQTYDGENISVYNIYDTFDVTDVFASVNYALKLIAV